MRRRLVYVVHASRLSKLLWYSPDQTGASRQNQLNHVGRNHSEYNTSAIICTTLPCLVQTRGRGSRTLDDVEALDDPYNNGEHSEDADAEDSDSDGEDAVEETVEDTQDELSY